MISSEMERFGTLLELKETKSPNQDYHKITCELVVA